MNSLTNFKITCTYFHFPYFSSTLLISISIFLLIFTNDLTEVQGFGDDYGGGGPPPPQPPDYGGGPPDYGGHDYGGRGGYPPDYGDRGPMDYDPGMGPPPPHNVRPDMMEDINGQRKGRPNEASTKKKKFKLFEKRRYNHEKAKAFCKKRNGQLAQAMDVDEMHRIQLLIMKGTTLSTSVWIGADKRDWKRHASKQIGRRPNLPAGATMMGGGPTAMCPAMSLSTRSTTPVECYKEFAFICEFELGKEKIPPKKIKAKGKGKKKTTKKDEMRKKREIFKISPTIIPSLSSSTQTETAESAEESATEQSTENPEIEEYERQHNIGFQPHIAFSENIPKTTSVSPTSSQEENNAREVLDDLSDEKVASLPPTYHRRLGLVEDSVNNDLGVEDNMNYEDQIIHPDQKMVNLFDEQLENMRLVEPEEHKHGFRMIHGTPKTTTTEEASGSSSSDVVTDFSNDDTTMIDVQTEFYPVQNQSTEIGDTESAHLNTSYRSTDISPPLADSTTTSADSVTTTSSYSESSSPVVSVLAAKRERTNAGGGIRDMRHNKSLKEFPGPGTSSEINFKEIPLFNRLVA